MTWHKNASRVGQWDVGHIKGAGCKTLVDALIEGEITQEQFLKEYKTPDNYKPENSSSNRSRVHDQ